MFTNHVGLLESCLALFTRVPNFKHRLLLRQLVLYFDSTLVLQNASLLIISLSHGCRINRLYQVLILLALLNHLRMDT